MFDGLFICQRVSTSSFCLKIDYFYQNYFCIRNDYDREIFWFSWKSSSGLADVFSFVSLYSNIYKPIWRLPTESKKIIYHNYFPYKNNFDKFVFIFRQTLKSKRCWQINKPSNLYLSSILTFLYIHALSSRLEL